MSEDQRIYRLQTQVESLQQTVDKQGRTIDALIASLPQMGQPTAPTGKTKTSAAGKTYREWVSWLQMNEPAYRQTIMDAVGKPMPGNQPVVDWTTIMSTWPDNTMPPDTLCKINGQSSGLGRPPVIYFLWSQRFDIYERHGVGPSERPEPETMLGVVHPVFESASVSGVPSVPTAPSKPAPTKSEPSEEIETERFATLEEWYEKWDPVFDVVAKYGAPVADDEKEEMRSTLPEDTEQPHHEIIAMAVTKARQRARSTE